MHSILAMMSDTTVVLGLRLGVLVQRFWIAIYISVLLHVAIMAFDISIMI